MLAQKTPRQRKGQHNPRLYGVYLITSTCVYMDVCVAVAFVTSGYLSPAIVNDDSVSPRFWSSIYFFPHCSHVAGINSIVSAPEMCGLVAPIYEEIKVQERQGLLCRGNQKWCS